MSQFIRFTGDDKHWTRLVPRSESHSIEEGLQAKVKDPLWFLSRQWQMGEFRATDGGHPIKTEVNYQEQMVDGYKAKEDISYQPLNSIPLETMVEQEQEPDFGEEQKPPAAWESTRLEYQFSVSAGMTELEAAGYSGQGLDWYDFKLANNLTIKGQDKSLSIAPVPVKLRGMAHKRWWRFEDNQIDFGSIKRPNLNYVSMLLSSFCLFYAGNWYTVPIKQKYGSIRFVNTVTVTDSFGNKTDLNPIHDNSQNQSAWSLFTNSGEKM